MTTTTDVAAVARPVRVQLSRKRGWRMPANTVSVARPGPFGNPYKIGDPDRDGNAMRAPHVVIAFRDLVVQDSRWAARIQHLRGKNLACWCPLDRPCHADVLLELANVRRHIVEEGIDGRS